MRRDSVHSSQGLLIALCDGGEDQPRAMDCAEACNLEFADMLAEKPDVSDFDENDTVRSLHDGLRRSNELLLQLAETEDAGRGMVSSIGALWFTKKYLLYSHVGNVRIYRYSGQVLQLLTEDHTEAWALVKEGKITPEKLVNYPGNRNFTQLLGGTGKTAAELKVERCKVEPGDAFLLCSDGVTHYLSDRTLESLFEAATDEHGALSCDLSDRILAMARERSEGKAHASVAVVQAFASVSRWTSMIEKLELES